MTYKKAVYLYPNRQILFAFVRSVEHLRRVMKRREINPPKIDVPTGFLVGYGNALLYYCMPRGRYIKHHPHRNQQQEHYSQNDACNRQRYLPYERLPFQKLFCTPNLMPYNPGVNWLLSRLLSLPEKMMISFVYSRRSV